MKMTSGFCSFGTALLLAVACACAVLPPARASTVSKPEPGAGAAGVRTGIDVLAEGGFERLQGRRLGLITNQTGIDRTGISTIERLHQAPEVQLVALFSPEHGLQGQLDIQEISDSTESGTGIHVFSLYGEHRQPSREMLRGIDTLVFDIQDIGTRYYTYISTLGLAMHAAAAEGLGFVVLDRPNPITGTIVGGPVRDPGEPTFTAFHPLPVRHGMTVGELALMFRSELGLELDLEIIRMEGWRRDGYFDQTGLRWVNPSPNMRSLTQALLYPGIGLLESTNLSVGRGTDTPFEVIGAPWLDGESFARAINALELPGVAFVPIRFTPVSSKFAGQTCGGINVLVIDRAAFDPLRTGLELASMLHRMYPETWDIDAYARLLVSAKTLESVRAGAAFEVIASGYREGLEHFLRRRAPFLLYP